MEFYCNDDGNVFGINSLVDEKFVFKINVKVMMVWNIFDDIENGIIGIFYLVKGE